jgi:hypothetical protein
MATAIARLSVRFLGGTAAGFFGLALSSGSVWAETAFPPMRQPAPGAIFEPFSNTALPADVGKKAHTVLRVGIPSLDTKGKPQPASLVGPPVVGLNFETPASLACAYQIVASVPGCNPNVVTATANGGSKMIAIVDAFDYSTAATDLAAFSTQFGLPAPNLQVVNLGGTPGNAAGTGWDLEASLDIEWAHAMAPKAKIVLVEAASDQPSDLFNAVITASQIVQQAGGGEVSMSWVFSEFPQETQIDPYLTFPGVVYYAASGDSSGTNYPCVSPNVVCVGGVTHSRNPRTFALERIDIWQSTGGGMSTYESIPSYQASLAGVVGAYRGVPDVAAIADPTTGVWVVNSTYYGPNTWLFAGGTSAATPVTAGIDNLRGNFHKSSVALLTNLYGSKGSGHSGVFNGECGPAAGYLASSDGWDFCTGWGVPGSPH